MTQSTLSSQITQGNSQGVVHQQKVTMRASWTYLNHCMTTLRLALTQGTLTCRTSTQVAQGPWRKQSLRDSKGKYLTLQQATLTPQHADLGFLDITHGNQVTAGIEKDDLDNMSCAPFLDEFLKKYNWGRPLKVRIKNTARVRVTVKNPNQGGPQDNR